MRLCVNGRQARLRGSASNWTSTYGRAMALITDAKIALAFDHEKNEQPSNEQSYKVLWDTGASNSVITEKVVQECNLLPIGLAGAFRRKRTVMNEILPQKKSVLLNLSVSL